MPKRVLTANFREEHSMDQYRSRLKLSENFERHCSILISGEIHMDQSLVYTFSWGNSYGPMVLKVFLKFPLHWHWSMDGSSQNFTVLTEMCTKVGSVSFLQSALAMSMSKKGGLLNFSAPETSEFTKPLGSYEFCGVSFRKNNRKEPRSSVRFWAATGV